MILRKIKKAEIVFLCAFFCLPCFFISAEEIELSAHELAKNAAAKDSLELSVNYLKKTVPLIKSPAERRAGYAFLGSVQEQTGDYQDAMQSYALAAGIGAGDAENMPKKSGEQLVLDAVRCALNLGDWKQAQTFLNSAVRNSSDEKILSLVRLYEQWCVFCKSETFGETKEACAILKTYADLNSMKSVRPQVLFSLWHVTGEEQYARALKNEYPKTPEALVAGGEMQILPSPFWYFVPRFIDDGSEQSEHASGAVSVQKEKNQPKTEDNSKSDDDASSSQKSASADGKTVRLQLGLFREKENAEALRKEVSGKGFDAYVTTEKRPSGTVYYLVVVDDDISMNLAPKLRSAGFDCYAVQ